MKFKKKKLLLNTFIIVSLCGVTLDFMLNHEDKPVNLDGGITNIGVVFSSVYDYGPDNNLFLTHNGNTQQVDYNIMDKTYYGTGNVLGSRLMVSENKLYYYDDNG